MAESKQSTSAAPRVSQWNRSRGLAMRLALSVASLMLFLPNAFAQRLMIPTPKGVIPETPAAKDPETSPSAAPLTRLIAPSTKLAVPTTPNPRPAVKSDAVVTMIFPVMGGAQWSDTYGKPRAGESRAQQGQDLLAPKMRPLLACFDGVWTGQGIRGDNGYFASYGNINNDTPGTDDGLAREEYSYAPGVWPGARVRAGQHIAYCGDSGDAEATGPRLHFELSAPNRGVINPAAALRAALVLQQPLYVPVRPEMTPDAGQLRMDGEVVSVDTPRGVASVRVAAWIKGKNKISAQTRPTQRWVKLATPDVRDQLRQVEQGDFVAILGEDPGNGQAVVAKEILPLQLNKTARQLRAAQKPPVQTAPAESATPVEPPAEGTLAVEPPPEELSPNPPAIEAPKATVLADFESGYYQGWETTGNCWGRTIDGASIASSAVRGWGGLYFLTTARSMPGSKNLSSGTGRARSTAFVIPPDASEIRFLIAGGSYPDRCCLSLLEEEKVLRTATGGNPFKMQTVIWDVSDLRGKTVRLEIRDMLTVGVYAYIHVDDIVLLCGDTSNLAKDTPNPLVQPAPATAPLPRTAPSLPNGVPIPESDPGSLPDGGDIPPTDGGP